jgi:hypothetical protein
MTTHNLYLIGWSGASEAINLLYSGQTLYLYFVYRGVKKLAKRAANRDRNPQMTRFLNFEKSFFLKPNMALLFAVVNIFIS